MCIRVAGIAAAISVLATGAAAQSIDAQRAAPLRCEYAPAGTPSATQIAYFPDGDLFRPLVADPKEPRNSFGYGRVRVLEGPPISAVATPATNMGSVSVGGVVGIWARKRGPCLGVQVSLFGGLFSEFDLDAVSRDLLNTDFVVGAQVAVRTKGLSARLRVFHQSSHLGDEIVSQNPSAGGRNFGFQALEGLVSMDRTRWRAYGGGGYLFFMDGGGRSVLLRGGAEVRAARRLIRIFRPIAGADVVSLQARSWGVTIAASGGLEWTSPLETRRMRVVMTYVNGYTPFGQFVLRQRSRALGARLQIEF